MERYIRTTTILVINNLLKLPSICINSKEKPFDPFTTSLFRDTKKISRVIVFYSLNLNLGSKTLKLGLSNGNLVSNIGGTKNKTPRQR